LHAAEAELTAIDLPFFLRTAASIIELLRLEKTSKIFKSNRQCNTTIPAKACPEVPCLQVF